VNFLLINLLIWISGALIPAFHPVHVSVCNLEMKDNECSISIKLFKDDFTLAIKNTCNADIQMEKADEIANYQIISKYINTCLQLELNSDKILKLEFISSEINEDAIWVNFKTESYNSNLKLTIRNTLMLDLWDDQTNLMIIKHNGKETGYMFNKRNVEIEIDLNG